MTGAGPGRATRFPARDAGQCSRPGAPTGRCPRPPTLTTRVGGHPSPAPGPPAVGPTLLPARGRRAHQPDWRALASYSRTDADTLTLSESAVPSIGTATRSKPCSYQSREIPYRSEPTTRATRPA
jgi:hypothetical protein